MYSTYRSMSMCIQATRTTLLQPTNHPTIHPSIHLSVCLSINLSVNQSINQSARPSPSNRPPVQPSNLGADHFAVERNRARQGPPSIDLLIYWSPAGITKRPMTSVSHSLVAPGQQKNLRASMVCSIVQLQSVSPPPIASSFLISTATRRTREEAILPTHVHLPAPAPTANSPRNSSRKAVRIAKVSSRSLTRRRRLRNAHPRSMRVWSRSPTRRSPGSPSGNVSTAMSRASMPLRLWARFVLFPALKSGVNYPSEGCFFCKFWFFLTLIFWKNNF